MTGLLDNETSERIDDVMRINFYGSFHMLCEAAKRMSCKLGGKGGAIVNISAGSAFTGKPLAYAISKAALNCLTTGIVDELALHGIRINTVSPGPTETDMMSDFSRHEIDEMAKAVPMGRVGEASEIAAGVRWLLSDEASYVSGTNLRIAGGKTLYN